VSEAGLPLFDSLNSLAILSLVSTDQPVFVIRGPVILGIEFTNLLYRISDKWDNFVGGGGGGAEMQAYFQLLFTTLASSAPLATSCIVG
jgi:hypothetical protein